MLTRLSKWRHLASDPDDLLLFGNQFMSEGLIRILDFGGVIEFKRDASFADDVHAFASDWAVVGEDLEHAIREADREAVLDHASRVHARA